MNRDPQRGAPPVTRCRLRCSSLVRFGVRPEDRLGDEVRASSMSRRPPATSRAAPFMTWCITLASQLAGRSVRKTPSSWPRRIRSSTRRSGFACSSRMRSGRQHACAASSTALGRAVSSQLDSISSRRASPRLAGQVDALEHLVAVGEQPHHRRLDQALARREVPVERDPSDSGRLRDLARRSRRSRARGSRSPPRGSSRRSGARRPCGARPGPRWSACRLLKSDSAVGLWYRLVTRTLLFDLSPKEATVMTSPPPTRPPRPIRDAGGSSGWSASPS